MAVVTALAMLVVWFPFNALWRQQSALDSTAAQIAAIKAQDHSLSAQAKAVSTKAQAILMAREQYQLVSPGQSLIQVLPGSGGYVSANAGDPGFQPLAAPVSNAPSAEQSAPVVTHHATNGFFARLLHTLEFWH
ncbi:MAG: hypothetical protein HIU84_11075 [Acidobacteria bacterium]|nr:hypothetical protein [Acidobacteriota bacterium]